MEYKAKEKLVEEVKSLLKGCLEQKEDSYGNELEHIYIDDMLVVLEQNIGSHEYTELTNYLENMNYELMYDVHNSPYDLGKIDISIFDVLQNTLQEYEIIFNYITEWEGYCMCNPTDEQYNYEYKCCGIDCDWDRPKIMINKIIPLGSSSFKGLQRDLWEYKKKINQEVDNTHKIKYERIKEIQLEKDELNKEYNQLLKDLDLIEEDFTYEG